MILDSLRYWVTEMHVDGFRFDLAVRADPDRPRGGHAQPPAHHDRPGPGAARRQADRRAVGRVDGRLPGRRVPAAVGGVERPVPRHRPGLLARPLRRRPRPSPPGWPAPPTCTPTTAARRTPRSTSSPPTTASRCATWSPTTHKHNEANGEDNRDGTDNNRSWNHGVEGETDDPDVVALRRRQAANLMATLCLSNGVPMITAGDERGRTQRGNNNAYCQDNEISWVDWRARRRLAGRLRGHPDRAAAAARAPGAAAAALVRGPADRSGAARRTWPGSTRPGREMTGDDWYDAACARFGMFVSGAPLRSPGPHGEQQRDSSFLMWFNAADRTAPVDAARERLGPRRARSRSPPTPGSLRGRRSRPATGCGSAGGAWWCSGRSEPSRCNVVGAAGVQRRRGGGRGEPDVCGAGGAAPRPGPARLAVMLTGAREDAEDLLQSRS